MISPELIIGFGLALLSQYVGKKAVIRIANNEMQGNEPTEFAGKLCNVFAGSGWDTTLYNSGNMIANGVVTTGITINALGKDNFPIADFIYKQLNALDFKASCKYYSSVNEDKDLFVEVWTK
jgi:hypothetical protein